MNIYNYFKIVTILSHMGLGFKQKSPPPRIGEGEKRRLPDAEAYFFSSLYFLMPMASRSMARSISLQLST